MSVHLRTSGDFTASNNEENLDLNEAKFNNSTIVVNEEPVLTLLKSSQEIQDESKVVENAIALNEQVAEIKVRKHKSDIKSDLDSLSNDIKAQQEALSKLLTEGEDKSTLLAALKMQQTAAEAKIQNNSGDYTDLISRTNPENLKKKAELHNQANLILADVKRNETVLKFQNDYMAIKIDQLPKLFEAQKTLLTKLVNLHEMLDKQLKGIQNYHHTSEHLTPYSYFFSQSVKEESKSEFDENVTNFVLAFNPAHDSAVKSQKDLEGLVTDFTEQNKKITELRNNHKAVSYEAKPFWNALAEDEVQLQANYKGLVNEWNIIKTLHHNLRIDLAVLESVEESETKTFASKSSIKLKEAQNLSYNPAATLL